MSQQLVGPDKFGREPLWYHYDQNNSGGYFISNDDVGEDVFIQAYSAEEADEMAWEIVREYTEYCDCCGERWYIDAHTGTKVPEKYGKSVVDGSYKPYYDDGHAILYGLNGTVAKVSRQGMVVLRTVERIE